METIILNSLLRIPVQPRQMIARPRLTASLEKNIPLHRMTLLSAPAGSGKTTLLAEWARASSLPVAWLSTSREGNDVERFLRYLLAAWETVQPDITETPLGILLGSRMPDVQAVLAAFINVADLIPEHQAIIIDDYHFIEDGDVHKAMTFIINHLPEKLHLVISSRQDPPLPLARYRARNQLFEIRTGQLLFTDSESVKFAEQSIGLALSPEEISALHHGTEGWITGLQLAALALKQPVSGARRAELVSGRQRFIADYLKEDVLDRLPLLERGFLLKTSILERMTGSLCDAVTGRQDGQSMLERLERENLFVFALDDRREWFRYHSLFHEFLRSELNRQLPEVVNHLHVKAAGWYTSHKMEEPALQHVVAGDDAELAIRIAEPYLHRMLLSGQIRMLEKWLSSLPQTWYADYPFFSFARACLYAIVGSPEAVSQSLREVEGKLAVKDEGEIQAQLGKVSALRCAMACFQNDIEQAERYADQALAKLPQIDHTYHAMIYHALGDTYRQIGRWHQAREYYLKVLDLHEDPAYRIRSVHVYGALADLDLHRGHLQDAAAYWRQAKVEIPTQKRSGSLPLPVIGWVYIRMGEIYYEWNRLAEAGAEIAYGLKVAEAGGDIQAMIAGYLIAGRLKLTVGDEASAAEFLDQARPMVNKIRRADWNSRFDRLQLDIWLTVGNLKKAVDWLEKSRGDTASAGWPENIAAQLTVARVLIFKGDRPSLDEALGQLGDLLGIAENEGRVGIIIEVLALKAQADWRYGNRTDALTGLERALGLAEPEGYVRIFVDLGLPIGRLLQEARSRRVKLYYVTRLLDAFGSHLADEAPIQTVLPEPLTPREQEVLALIASGLTNREVAEKLVISPGTVKKHTGNLYRKLGVSNRTQAVARARQLHILP